jgi:sortase A
MTDAGDNLQGASTRTAGRVGATVLHEIQPSDLTLWSPGRITAWRASLTQPAPAPVAILRIPKIRLEVSVLPGTGDFVLNRGVGHIEDTPLPGANGNSGIAGHRDGFFRGLKDIATGDAIELETPVGRQVYRVDRTWIVKPEDVSVLDPTSVTTLTLVTCYPFYFVGEAPQRFVVRAIRMGVNEGISPIARAGAPAGAR